MGLPPANRASTCLQVMDSSLHNLKSKLMSRKVAANCSALHQRHKDYMARYNKTLARQAVGDYAGIAHKHGLTPTQLALDWNTQRWPVTSTIIGATTMDQLKVRFLI